MSLKISDLLNLFVAYLVTFTSTCYANDILGCGGFVKSHASLDFSKIEIGLYTKEGSLKERTECAPTNGYYFLPLYEKGEYILKVHPPAGWSFEPSQVELLIDGETDQCSTGQDINFSFNGFGITGRVITAGQKQGPSGIDIQLVNEKGDVRNTVTTTNGDFDFTPVIPGKYVVKATHSKWKIEPAQTVVQVKEGNTALPIGSLIVKGYDVSGSVISFGSPISGIYVLLYSKNENQKFRVEGCKTALLQGVPDAPICYSVTDAAGEFQFGLVPAGEYKLLAMTSSPGQPLVTYNIKPDVVPFAVLHDSLYIKNAFEVTAFSVRGRALRGADGAGVAGARVLRGGRAVATCDADGRFTLTGLKPATYTLTFQHEECEWDEVQLVVSSGGPSAALEAVAARWRVCGQLTPPEPRTLQLRPDLRVQAGDDGKWCAFVPSGEYTVKVEVTEQEQREGLQFFPEWQTVRVRGAAVGGVAFGQVRATVRGRVECGAHCAGLAVALRPLKPDGGYAGPPRYAPVVDGEYSFEDVVPGGVELSVEATRLCWEQAAHNAAVTQRLHSAPAFRLRGLALLVSASHALQLHYESADGAERGELAVPAGDSRQCLPPAERYTLSARGCHRVQPASAPVRLGGPDAPRVRFVATAHAAVVDIVSPEPATDVLLQIVQDGRPPEEVPLQPVRRDGVYVYEHTMYLEEGAAAEVWARSASLLFSPRGAVRVSGGADCARVLSLRAARALVLAGRLQPSVSGVLVTLEGGDVRLTQTTEADGKYSFGPLDADIQYTVRAEKESYAFDEPDENGIIVAHKLAEIAVVLRDRADHAPLEGALVSVSGGAFRRNVASGAAGALRFAALSPAQYYVKPHMKEYRFEPPHAIVAVEDGQEHRVVFEGVRVAWSLLGRVVSLGGAGAARVALRARPASSPARPHCAQQDASASDTGHFRIRGLLPGCVYVVELKESVEPELAGIVLARQPPPFEMKEKDIENVRLIVVHPNHLTDANVLIRTPNIDHYKTLRLTLALESTPHNLIYSTKLDPLGYNQFNNPGLMYTMPRLPADNKTYVVQIESSLSKVSHSYEEPAFYFNSDGKFKSFDIDFDPKLRSSEQELRHSPLALLALLSLGALYSQRARLAALRPLAARPRRAPRDRS
ncbi:BOS complex subunit NOMO1 [Vanessa tameamea]|uniref:BOS complex subunit NOMO1 n=1 Tax=Vanessa tameamea TaxID=334116 RepID=A0A8B8I6K1_VANTA